MSATLRPNSGFWTDDGQPGSYAQDGLSESQASAVNRGRMYLKTEAAGASGRLQRRMETIDRYVPNVLRSSSHFRVAKSAHPRIPSDDARRTGVLVEVGRCHGRGREFESRRLRHSFEKNYADFIETVGDAKRARFAPFLCPFSAARSFLSRNECLSILFGRGRKRPGTSPPPALHASRASPAACTHPM